MLKPNPQLMLDNPLSKIPTLVLPDGTTLLDSVVICDYLNDRVGGSLFPAVGAAKWQALRWHALGDGMLDALILWRNERERVQRLDALLMAFEFKTLSCLQMLEREVDALDAAPFSIGHITLACALGYLDFRFDSFGWRGRAPQLARWHAEICMRPSFLATEPTLEG